MSWNLHVGKPNIAISFTDKCSTAWFSAQTLLYGELDGELGSTTSAEMISFEQVSTLGTRQAQAMTRTALHGSFVPSAMSSDIAPSTISKRDVSSSSVFGYQKA